MNYTHMLKYLSWLVMVFLLYSCKEKPTSLYQEKINYDSLSTDILISKILSIDDAERKIQIPNYLVEGDTLLVKNTFIAFKDLNGNEFDNQVELDSGSLIIVIGFDRLHCRVRLLSPSSRDSSRIYFLPLNDALRIAFEYLDELKIQFYDYQKIAFVKYEKAICKKYGITLDELDSLSFVTDNRINQLRGRFDP